MNKKPFLYLLAAFLIYNITVVVYFQFPKIIHISKNISFTNKTNTKIGSELNSIINVSKTQKFCESIKKLKPILDTYSKLQWPVTGVPGVAFGITQNSSALEDMCDFLSKTKDLKLDKTVFNPQKWDKDLEMADNTWNMANDLYDFKTGKTSSLNSTKVHRSINKYLKSSKLFMADTKNNKVIIYKNKEEI